MAGSLNCVTLIGNLGRDPEVKTMQNGDKVANLSVATSESWRDKAGNRQERTEWHRVVVFGKLAEVIEKYLRKGSKVYLGGKLQTRKWTDQGGQDRYTTEIVLSGFGGRMIMLDGKPSGDGGPKYGDHRSGDYEPDQSRGGSLPAPPTDDFDDEIPF